VIEAVERKYGTLMDVIGIVGAGLMVLSDLLLLYVPVPRSQYDFLEIAKRMPETRVIVGDYLGLLGTPLVLVGLYRICLVLRPAGRWHSLPPVLLLGYAYLLGAVFHHAVSMIMTSARHEVPGGVGDVLTADLVTKFLVPLGIAFLTVAAVGSAWLFITLFVARTAYSRWMAFLSPLVLVLVFRAVILVAPPIVVGALVPAGPNLAMLVFFMASAAWLRSRRVAEAQGHAV
jgi:hypothetical protein